MPTVSIGLPVFNGEKYLESAIASILNQTYQDFELIISDNASTDSTEKIAKHHASIDSRVRYYRNNQNIGAGRNYNRVFELANGEYFKWASHDDMCATSYIEKCVEVLNRDPEIILSYPRTVIVDEDGCFVCRYNDLYGISSYRAADRFKSFIFRRGIGECNAVFGLIRSSCLKETALIENYVGADYVLLAHLSLLGKFHQIPEDLFFRRDHPETSVRANPEFSQVAYWYDPAKKKKILLPRWRRMYEYFKRILIMELGFRDRIFCLMLLIKKMKISRQHFINELYAAAKLLFRRSKIEKKII